MGFIERLIGWGVRGVDKDKRGIFLFVKRVYLILVEMWYLL